MTTSLLSTPTVPRPSSTRTPGVPCAARPGTPYRHPDGRCECFFGGPAPELADPPYPMSTSG